MIKKKVDQLKLILKENVKHILQALIVSMQSSQLRKHYSGFFRDIKILLSIHNFFDNIKFSPYFHLSIVLSIVTQIFSTDDWVWYDTAIAILPSIVGMSLTGYALILTFGSEQFRDVLRGPSLSDEASPYMKTSTAFAYFLTVQTNALILAIICKAVCTKSIIFSFIGTLVLIYGILLAIAATMTAFFLSRMYDIFSKD